MKLQLAIESKITQALKPDLLEIENESYKHSSGKGAESHFKVLVVAHQFTGLSRVQRQRVIHDLLADEMKNGIHALSLRLLSPDERSQAEGFVTPNCQSKK